MSFVIFAGINVTKSSDKCNFECRRFKCGINGININCVAADPFVSRKYHEPVPLYLVAPYIHIL